MDEFLSNNYESKNIEHAADLISNPNWNLINGMNNHLRNNIGTRKKNMSRFIKVLDNQFNL